MYHFFDDFKVYDDACQPYSLTAERSSALPHTHAAVDSRGFSIQCPGNKYILLTPPLSDFRLRFNSCFRLKSWRQQIPINGA